MLYATAACRMISLQACKNKLQQSKHTLRKTEKSLLQGQQEKGLRHIWVVVLDEQGNFAQCPLQQCCTAMASTRLYSITAPMCEAHAMGKPVQSIQM
jgi:hypothetical protein